MALGSKRAQSVKDYLVTLEGRCRSAFDDKLLKKFLFVTEHNQECWQHRLLGS
jgi:hypothetical protein